MHERNAEEKNRYFSEVTRNLQREGLNVLSEQDGFLPVELDSQPLCLILDSGMGPVLGKGCCQRQPA